MGSLLSVIECPSMGLALGAALDFEDFERGLFFDLDLEREEAEEEEEVVVERFFLLAGVLLVRPGCFQCPLLENSSSLYIGKPSFLFDFFFLLEEDVFLNINVPCIKPPLVVFLDDEDEDDFFFFFLRLLQLLFHEVDI
tara:strand:- start:24 stop:440 length:417 start_codon:yes stop_codon:yes gene_type:complete